MPAYRAKKRLGQHFLQSPEIIDRILDVIQPKRGHTIVEIGPGHGSLTLPLAQSGAQIIAVEFDRDIMHYLTKFLKSYENVKVINQDFLSFEPRALSVTRFFLTGNLPFNITSPVIDWAIEHREMLTGACLMIQKELAARLTASPKCKDWSPLSIFTKLYFDVIRCFDVPSQCFRPKPKVTASVIELTPKRKQCIENFEQFERVVRASFHHRRKLLVNNLVPAIVPEPQKAHKILGAIGLPENTRAEEVSTEQFLRLTECLIAHKLL
jgi:16S rRNA (adenine1518-N6/adenine1519-N6)-dimethyltransferase